MWIGTRLSLIVVAMVAVVTAPYVSRAETISIQGRILFADGSVPTAAHVTVASGTTFKVAETDTNGNYAVADLPSGTYNLAAFGTGQDKAGSFTQAGLVIESDTTLPIIVNATLAEPTSNQ